MEGLVGEACVEEELSVGEELVEVEEGDGIEDFSGALEGWVVGGRGRGGGGGGRKRGWVEGRSAREELVGVWRRREEEEDVAEEAAHLVLDPRAGGEGEGHLSATAFTGWVVGGGGGGRGGGRVEVEVAGTQTGGGSGWSFFVVGRCCLRRCFTFFCRNV